MPLPSLFAADIGFAFLLILGAYVAHALLVGRISTRGLLQRKAGRNRVRASPERVQMLIVTIVTAGTYLVDVFDKRGAAVMPDAPAPLIAAFGSSQLLYLLAKAAHTYLQPVAGLRNGE